MFMASVGGGYIRDRLSQETRESAGATRIEALSNRIEALERHSLPEAQFRDFQSSTDKRLEDIRLDLRELKKLVSRP